MSLNEKQKRFVAEYLKDLNATQAAIRTGYSEKTAQEQSSRLLSKVIIQEAIQKEMNKRAKKTEVTQEMIVNELKRIAFSGMKNVASWNESGVRFKPSEDLSDDDAASVQEVHESTNQHGGSLKIKQYDKLKALELLGRHMGMFTDKLEIIEEDRPLEDLSDSELEKKLKGNGK